MNKQLSKRAILEKDIIKKVNNTIKKYEMIQNGDTIIVGVSGGPDSMALLHILWKMQKEKEFTLVVAHFNHCIRKEADEETKYVEEFCKSHEIPCYIEKKDVIRYAKEHKIGTEEAGRKMRYAFFEEVAQKQHRKNIKIATAHQANDNAETVFMNILRGTGISGLKGIEPIRNNYYIRPLIQIQRNEIEEYCEREKLFPKLDSSNKDNKYTRNKVRNLLFPFIEQNFDTNIVNACNRMSQICMEENEYIENIAKNELNKIQENLGSNQIQGKNDIILSLKKFNNEEKVLQKRIIVLAIDKVLGNSQEIAKINIEDIVTMCNKSIGNKYIMPNKYIKIKIQDKKIFFEKIK